MPLARIQGLEVYYEVRGSGEPLLLIHGLGSSTQDWEHQVDRFAERYTVVTYDVRGHGQSGKPRGRYSVPQFARDAAGLIERLGIGPMHVQGISMGGMIALQLAVDAPHLVRSLTIVNSGPEMILRTMKQRIAIYQRFVIVRLMGMRKMGLVLSTALLPRPEHEQMRALFVERWARNNPGAYLRALRALIGWSVSARLGTIKCPTLILTADQDYTPVAYKQFYTAAIPGAQLVVIRDSRHMLPLERPAEYNDAVMDFLAGVTAKQAVPPSAASPRSGTEARA
jgi:pimeloyl-ACP methyl ester carboxylesterase